MAIYVEINPREREATLRSAHSLCAGEFAEIVLSGVPDADTATLSLRLYRDRSEAEFVAAARRPGDADPPQEGFAAVQGRAALRRAVLDLRSESVASWASDVFERSESGSDGPEGAPRPPETAWMVVADVSRVWAACGVPFLLRPMSPESADVALTLPSLVERAREAAESAERSASAASASALEASQAAARAEAATSGKADLVDGRVPASQLPSYVDDVLEVAELPSSGESGKLYVVTGTNAVYRWSGSGFVEVSPSPDWSGELAAKRDRTDLSVGRDKWLLEKPDGTQAWLVKPDPQQDEWTGDGFTLTYTGAEGIWGIVKNEGGIWVVDDTVALPPDASRLEFSGSDGTSVYRLVRGSRLALDTEIPPEVTVDDSVTRTSANPVKSSGIWGAIWGALTALPSGFASLYDWCVAQLADKRGMDELGYGPRPQADAWYVSKDGDAVVTLYPHQTPNTWTSGPDDGTILRFVSPALWILMSNDYPGMDADIQGQGADATELDFGNGYVATRRSVPGDYPDRLALLSQVSGKYTKPDTGIPASDLAQAVQDVLAVVPAKQDALSAQQLANIAAVPNKADAADLRYRIAEAGYATTGAKLPDGVTVRMNGEVVNYEIERFSLPPTGMVKWRMVIAGGMAFVWDEDGTTGVDGMLGYKFYDANGDEIQGVPNLLVPHALADRAINGVAVSAAGAASLVFPAPVEGKVRDFLVRLTLGEGASVNFPDTVAYETEDGKWPDFTEAGTYIVRLTETEEADESTTPATPARFLLQVSSVAEAAVPSAATAGGGE